LRRSFVFSIGHVRGRRPWRPLSLGVYSFAEQRIPKICDNMDVVTRLREHAGRYMKCHAKRPRSCAD